VKGLCGVRAIVLPFAKRLQNAYSCAVFAIRRADNAKTVTFFREGFALSLPLMVIQ
jgi:hypothetical protein